MMFFSFSIVGWLWEVGLHLVSEGVFRNRGVLLGPWLPIYGTGGVLIVLLLKRLAKKPIVLFTAAMILCGIVEYVTSWYLEYTKGIKWWDYSGYLLNLNGRICLESVVVFGIGGCGFVYLIAPMFDNLYQKIPRSVEIPLCVVMIAVFSADVIHSKSHPNTGEGVSTVASADNAYYSRL